MSFVTVEVDIDHGRIVPREPGKLPESGKGVLTIFTGSTTEKQGKRIQLPLIRGDGKNLINPSPRELDASLWGE